MATAYDRERERQRESERQREREKRADNGAHIKMLHYGINGPKRMSNPICVDLSHWNPTPDWFQLVAGGTLGVIHKATDGGAYVDDMLFARAGPAIEAGLAWCTYHFMEPGGIDEQMAHYLEVVDPRPGERMVLDHEIEEVSLDDLELAVDYLLRQRPDLQITIYSGHLIKDQLGNGCNNFLAANTSLWVAQYSDEPPSWPEATWPTWSLWQYTDKAKVSGIAQPVDGNRFNGSPEAFLEWMGPSLGLVPEPAPAPFPDRPRQVSVNIQADPGVEVTVVVNGEFWRGAE